jgi:hypothetical protein
VLQSPDVDAPSNEQGSRQPVTAKTRRLVLPRAQQLPTRELVSIWPRAPAALLTSIAENGATAFLIILAMTFGLILPRMLLEHFLSRPRNGGRQSSISAWLGYPLYQANSSDRARSRDNHAHARELDIKRHLECDGRPARGRANIFSPRRSVLNQR